TIRRFDGELFAFLQQRFATSFSILEEIPVTSTYAARAALLSRKQFSWSPSLERMLSSWPTVYALIPASLYGFVDPVWRLFFGLHTQVNTEHVICLLLLSTHPINVLGVKPQRYLAPPIFCAHLLAVSGQSFPCPHVR